MSKSKSRLTVTLIEDRLSHGSPALDSLKLLIHDGQPAIYWSASWEGAYHHTDGASGYTVIPPEILPELTAQRLTDWLVEQFGSLPDMKWLPSFAKDARVTTWCSAVRQMYSSHSAPAGRSAAR